MAILLDQIIPWGRSRHEYELMFRLAFEDFSAGVLDCGGGPASFTAELSASGIRAISVDPIYVFSGLEIQGRFEAVVEPMLSQIRATPGNWTWTYHRDPDDLCANRRAALRRFLADYDEGSRKHRYIVGELPSLPFDSGSFGLAVCSHLLFCTLICSPRPFTSDRRKSCVVLPASTLLSAFDTTRCAVPAPGSGKVCSQFERVD